MSGSQEKTEDSGIQLGLSGNCLHVCELVSVFSGAYTRPWVPVWDFVGGDSLTDQRLDEEIITCSHTLLYVYNVNGAPEIQCSCAVHNLYASTW